MLLTCQALFVNNMQKGEQQLLITYQYLPVYNVICRSRDDNNYSMFEKNQIRLSLVHVIP